MEQLIKLYKEYIEFLHGTMISPQSIAHVHGWECPPEDIEKGIELRAKIEELEKEIYE